MQCLCVQQEDAIAAVGGKNYVSFESDAVAAGRAALNLSRVQIDDLVVAQPRQQVLGFQRVSRRSVRCTKNRPSVDWRPAALAEPAGHSSHSHASSWAGS